MRFNAVSSVDIVAVISHATEVDYKNKLNVSFVLMTAGKIPPDYYAAESSCMSYAWGNGLSPQEGQVLFALTVKNHKFLLVLMILCLSISPGTVMLFDF